MRLGCLVWDCLLMGMLMVPVLSILFGLAVPAFSSVQERARQVQAVNNARQIIITLQSYAKEHEGKYPESSNANEAFRELFRGGYVDDERIFTSPASPYVGDNNIGRGPHLEDALSVGENHWAMTKGVTSKDDGDIPLVFENPAMLAWPPEWDADVAGQVKPGRAWKGGRIVVGRNDGSVTAEKLTAAKGMASLMPVQDDKNLFELAGPHEIMDVAR